MTTRTVVAPGRDAVVPWALNLDAVQVTDAVVAALAPDTPAQAPSESVTTGSQWENRRSGVITQFYTRRNSRAWPPNRPSPTTFVT